MKASITVEGILVAPAQSRVQMWQWWSQMWQGCAQSRCGCGRGAPSLGADLAAVSPVPQQMWQIAASQRCGLRSYGVCFGTARRARARSPHDRLQPKQVILPRTHTHARAQALAHTHAHTCTRTHTHSPRHARTHTHGCARLQPTAAGSTSSLPAETTGRSVPRAHSALRNSAVLCGTLGQ